MSFNYCECGFSSGGDDELYCGDSYWINEEKETFVCEDCLKKGVQNGS